MTRKAILITTSSETNPTHFEDARALSTFLKSQSGGKWEEHEILSLENPTKTEIVRAIESARQSGYGFVMLAGRGKNSSSNLPWPEMEFPLSSKETISERELNPGSPRCVLFSTPVGINPQSRGLELPTEDSKNNTIYKTAYNEALTVAESGLVKLNISAKGPGSTVPSFTRYLIGEAKNWLMKNQGTISLGDAVNLAKAGLLRDGFQINVDYIPGRRRRDFPFAVKI